MLSHASLYLLTHMVVILFKFPNIMSVVSESPTITIFEGSGSVTSYSFKAATLNFLKLKGLSPNNDLE